MPDTEIMLRVGDYGGLRASPSSCSWLATAAPEWPGDWGPYINEDEGKLFLLCAEGVIEQPIEFCPGCGRKIEARDA